jgi:hypothetical protein
MSTILFDSASTRDLLSPTFAVPLIPASIHDDIPRPCEVCEVVHLPAHRRGPDALDVAWVSGRDAALDSRGPVMPPRKLGSAEVVAWFEGADVGRAERHRRLMDEAMRAEVDAEMASVSAGSF